VNLRRTLDLGTLVKKKSFSEDPIETRRGPIRCLPWRGFLDELWGDIETPLQAKSKGHAAAAV
jgi:hypothetical protein